MPPLDAGIVEDGSEPLERRSPLPEQPARQRFGLFLRQDRLGDSGAEGQQGDGNGRSYWHFSLD